MVTDLLAKYFSLTLYCLYSDPDSEIVDMFSLLAEER